MNAGPSRRAPSVRSPPIGRRRRDRYVFHDETIQRKNRWRDMRNAAILRTAFTVSIDPYVDRGCRANRSSSAGIGLEEAEERSVEKKKGVVLKR